MGDRDLPRVGSAVAVVDGDRILLGERAKDPSRGKWVLPGGKIEPFESIQAAATRELREETGLDVEIQGQIGTFEIISPPREHRLIVFSWAVPISGRLEPGSDLSDLRFFTKTELASVDVSEFIRDVLGRIGWLETPVQEEATAASV